jgi:hypothetical protein
MLGLGMRSGQVHHSMGPTKAFLGLTALVITWLRKDWFC